MHKIASGSAFSNNLSVGTETYNSDAAWLVLLTESGYVLYSTSI